MNPEGQYVLLRLGFEPTKAPLSKDLANEEGFGPAFRWRGNEEVRSRLPLPRMDRIGLIQSVLDNESSHNDAVLETVSIPPVPAGRSRHGRRSPPGATGAAPEPPQGPAPVQVPVRERKTVPVCRPSVTDIKTLVAERTPMRFRM